MHCVQLAHLVKSEDLNHHGTLFAGRMAEWFVEACFICGAKLTGHPEFVVCLKLHGLRFNAPANRGDIVNLETTLVKAGRTSFVVHGRANKNDSDKTLAEGFITFVYVDGQGRPQPHELTLAATSDPMEQQLRQQAAVLD